jgi:hypothetical protein
MLVLGLVHDRGWEPPPEGETRPERPDRRWDVPWRSLVWVALWCWLMALVPIVDGVFGGLAGYAVLLVAVALVFWRLERWCARQYWQGLREYKP